MRPTYSSQRYERCGHWAHSNTARSGRRHPSALRQLHRARQQRVLTLPPRREPERTSVERNPAGHADLRPADQRRPRHPQRGQTARYGALRRRRPPPAPPPTPQSNGATQGRRRPTARPQTATPHRNFATSPGGSSPPCPRLPTPPAPATPKTGAPQPPTRTPASKTPVPDSLRTSTEPI